MRDNKPWRGHIHDKFDLKITTFILISDLDMPKKIFAYIYIQSKAKSDQIVTKKRNKCCKNLTFRNISWTYIGSAYKLDRLQKKDKKKK